VVVALGGRIECRSNWKTYIDEFASSLHQLSGIAVHAEMHDSTPTEALTPFEAKYASSGHALWRCCAELPQSPDLAGILMDS
jgi:tRNA G46 methylase TrmB